MERPTLRLVEDTKRGEVQPRSVLPRPILKRRAAPLRLADNRERSGRGEQPEGDLLPAAPQDGFAAQSGETAPPTVGERIGKTFGSVIKNRAAGFANGQATLYQAGQSGRTSRDQELLEGYQYDLNRAQYDLSVMEEQNRQTPGYWSERDLQSQRYIIEDAQRKVDAVRQAASSGAQEKATQASYQVADNLAASSAKDDERAKEGLNAAGRFAVDLSKGFIELGIDGLTGKAFGNPVPLRALGTFGSNTQEARQAGATFQQQMAYGAGSAGADAAMRVLLNISEPYKKIYGEGPLNKMLQEVVDDLSKTARGRMALSAFVEGGKSLVESEIKHLLRRATYDEDARFDTAGAVYNVILSSAMGAITGAFSPRQKAEQEAQEEVVKPQDPDTIETKTESTIKEYTETLNLRAHILGEEQKVSRSRGIIGAHNKTNFLATLEKVGGRIERVVSLPEMDGVEQIYYLLPVKDATGELTGKYRGRKGGAFQKTVYDPEIFDTDEYIRRGIEAANDALKHKKGEKIGKKWCGKDRQGIEWNGFCNEDGDITSFYPAD